MQTLKSELPFFIWQLTQFEIPEALKCQRFGIKAYHHPELVGTLDESAPETKLLSLIDTCFKSGKLKSSGFKGTADELQTALSFCDETCLQAQRLLEWQNAAATYLGRLARKFPDRFKNLRTAHERSWTIAAPSEA
jgi:hypothetical protein